MCHVPAVALSKILSSQYVPCKTDLVMIMIMITGKTVKNWYIQGTSPTNNIIKIMFSSKINSYI